MYVKPRPVLAAIDRLSAPTLLCWGDKDEFIELPSIGGGWAAGPANLSRPCGHPGS
jgi:hypothetical protein